MSSYTKDILLRLIHKFNKRELKYSGKEINRSISIKPTELYKKYGSASGNAEIENDINAAAKILEDKGFISVRRIKFSDDIDTISLNTSCVTKINEYLEIEFGIKPRDFVVDKVRGLVEKYCKTGPLTQYYSDQLTYSLDHTLSDIDITKEKQTLLILEFIQNNKIDLYVREVSMLVFGSSKIFEERPFYENICTVIRNATNKPRDEYSTNDEILKDYHIYTVDQEILLKGDVTIVISGNTISLKSFQNGISLSSSDIPNIDSITLNTGKMLTIENKTAFYRFSSPDYCVMYLGGFANRHQIDLIKIIYHYNPLAHFSHFGDIDIGGFFIHQHLCRNTNISFDLFHMNIDDLHNSEYKTCLQSLTDNDRERAKSLLDSELYKRTISVMLEENIKLEQEIICLKLQRQFKTIK